MQLHEARTQALRHLPASACLYNPPSLSLKPEPTRNMRPINQMTMPTMGSLMGRQKPFLLMPYAELCSSC